MLSWFYYCQQKPFKPNSFMIPMVNIPRSFEPSLEMSGGITGQMKLMVGIYLLVMGVLYLIFETLTYYKEESTVVMLDDLFVHQTTSTDLR